MIEAPTKSKVIPFNSVPMVMERLRREGLRIVQCHGTFDLVHPGHIYHFEEAKALGDVLVVTITGEQYVNKGPGRPYFNDQLRVKSLVALECVDYVVVVPYPAAVEVIECVKPHIYCKGKEYEQAENDVTGNIRSDVETVTRLGAQIRYVGSVVHSSTKLLGRGFQTVADDVKTFSSSLERDFGFDQLRALVDSFASLNVLVVGDVIFDRYTTVAVQGLTSKNRMLSGRHISEETQAGGAMAVLRHLRQFTPNVKLVGLVGTEPWVEKSLREYVDPESDELVRIPGFTTIIKQRFVEPVRDGAELSKLFSVNVIDAEHPGLKTQEIICSHLDRLLPEADLVVVMDFGHGLLERSVRGLVQEQAKFMALNCQTNSNNHGFNIINRRYHRADSFSLDHTEMSLACGERVYDPISELNGLRKELKSTYGWLTRGSTSTIGVHTRFAKCECVPLESRVVDTIGAGDAFCSVVSLASVTGAPLAAATFLGQLAGAQAVRIVGNREPISKGRLLRSAASLMSV